MEISASTPLYFQGTILAGGTLSPEIDIGDASVITMMLTTVPTNGTLTFQVAARSDNDSQFGSGAAGGGQIRYVDLYDDAGALVSVTAPSSRYAVSAVKMAPLIGFRFIKIKSTPAQTNGLKLEFAGRP
jgi:hypothetical protein